MKTITKAEIIKAVDDQCKGSYHMSLVGAERRWVMTSVNHGIDAHLQACYLPDRGDSYADNGQRLECRVSGASLAVLLRRLTEDFDTNEESGDSPETLATDILQTLEFNVDCMKYKINSD